MYLIFQTKVDQTELFRFFLHRFLHFLIIVIPSDTLRNDFTDFLDPFLHVDLTARLKSEVQLRILDGEAVHFLRVSH